MLILGISCYYHDSAVALIENGEILFAAQEERFSRKKGDSSFPIQAIQSCLKETGKIAKEISAVVYYDKPFLTFERILETLIQFVPFGFTQFKASLPIWIKQKLFLKTLLLKELQSALSHDYSKRVFFSEHHLSHAASAFYPSPFQESAILTIDGVGEWATATIGKGSGRSIEFCKQMNFPHSWGLFYSAFTQFLGFKVNSGEYKFMGLSPYGNSNSKQENEFYQKIKDDLIELNSDGSLRLNLEYFTFTKNLSTIDIKKWEKLFGISCRIPESALNLAQANLAHAAQRVLEEGLLLLAKTAKVLTGSKNLVMAGGVALNCVANNKIRESRIFENIWVQPAADDAGGALGAALAFYYQHEVKRNCESGLDQMKGSLLGPRFSNDEVELAGKSLGLNGKFFSTERELLEKAVQQLNLGRVVGWFNGKMEWGPRALGSRSIIADARSEEMQKKLNVKIKGRESFRPFAPLVLEEKATEYFECANPSPYMLFTTKIKAEKRKVLPPHYEELEISDKLKTPRSDIQAVSHVDFSTRVQTVNSLHNPRLYHLLRLFDEQTQCPILVNTSFNVRGEPIVCRPSEALIDFLLTDMDCLFIENYYYCKADYTSDELDLLRRKIKLDNEALTD